MALRDLLTYVLGGDNGPTARPKINGMATLLANAVDGVLSRLTTLERGPAPPGGYVLGPDAATTVFQNYSANANGYWTTGTRKDAKQVPVSSGSGNDSYGKTAVSVVSASRYLLVSMDTNPSGSSNALQYRATLYDVAADGTQTQRATVAFAGSDFGGNAGASFGGVLGVEYSGGNVWRVVTVTEAPSSPYRGYAVSTLQWDGSSTSLSYTKDAGNYGNGAQNTNYGSFHNNGNHRKRLFRTGNNSFYCPCVGLNPLYVYATPIDPAVMGFSIERAAGSGFVAVPQLWDNHVINTGYSMDACGDNTFVVARPGIVAGAGGGTKAVVSLVRADDFAQSILSSVNLGNTPTGNMRVTALSQTLFVVGYNTSAGYASYLISRDLTTNVLSVIGAQGTNAQMNGAYDEAMAFSATKHVQFRRPAVGSTVNVETVAVDPAAASTASPFTLLKTAPIVIGQAFGGAAAGNDSYLTAAARLSPERAVLVPKNGNTGILSTEIWDFT